MSLLRKTLLSLLIASNACAEVTCDIPWKIVKGTASPCDGYVISPGLERDLRTDIVYKDKLIENLTQIQKSQEHTIQISNDQIKIYEDKLRSEQGVTDFQKTLYFSLGAALTGVIAYGAVKAVR